MAEAARDTYCKILSDNLNYLMKLYGYSRKHVSNEINVPYTTYTDWVNGKTYPQIESIQKLADCFHIEVSDLSRDISANSSLVKRVEAYAKGMFELCKEENVMFEHKSLQQRIDEYDGKVEVYEYDWSGLGETEYFNE